MSLRRARAARSATAFGREEVNHPFTDGKTRRVENTASFESCSLDSNQVYEVEGADAVI
jgi:hypothetical protein